MHDRIEIVQRAPEQLQLHQRVAAQTQQRYVARMGGEPSVTVRGADFMVTHQPVRPRSPLQHLVVVWARPQHLVEIVQCKANERVWLIRLLPGEALVVAHPAVLLQRRRRLLLLPLLPPLDVCAPAVEQPAHLLLLGPRAFQQLRAELRHALEALRVGQQRHRLSHRAVPRPPHAGQQLGRLIGALSQRIVWIELLDHLVCRSHHVVVALQRLVQCVLL